MLLPRPGCEDKPLDFGTAEFPEIEVHVDVENLARACDALLREKQRTPCGIAVLQCAYGRQHAEPDVWQCVRGSCEIWPLIKRGQCSDQHPYPDQQADYGAEWRIAFGVQEPAGVALSRGENERIHCESENDANKPTHRDTIGLNARSLFIPM